MRLGLEACEAERTPHAGVGIWMPSRRDVRGFLAGITRRCQIKTWRPLLPVYEASKSVSALALEFAILTAARFGEVLGARWGEIDVKAKLWTVPATRTGAGREHRVPLTPRALEILRSVENVKTGDYVFPGQRRGRPLSVTALAIVLRRLGFEKLTVHGFRSAFRDWAGNETSFARRLPKPPSPTLSAI